MRGHLIVALMGVGLLWDGVATAQTPTPPALLIDSGQVRSGESIVVEVNYFGSGSAVTDLDAVLGFDPDLFSSAIIRCGAAQAGIRVQCGRGAEPGRLRLAVSTDPRAEISNRRLAVIELNATLDARPQSTPIGIVVQRYFDADGNAVSPGTSSPGTIDILPPPAPTVIHRSRGARGDALIFPYFTARDRQETVVVLANTSPFAKALRVNVREALNGHTLIRAPFDGDFVDAFNLYLEAGETARLVIRPDPLGGARISTSACSVPAINGLLLSQAGFMGDPGPQNIRRTQEGYITVLAMADLTDGGSPAADLQAGNCGAIAARWQTDGQWAVDASSETNQPLGNVAGVASIRGLPGRLPFDFGATALVGFANGNLHTAPAAELHLGHGRTAARVDGMEHTFNTGAEAVSAVLMTPELTLPIRARGVAWMINYPTKWLFTDSARALMPPPVAPFSSTFGDSGACETALLFPNTLAISRELCWHSNVLPFNAEQLLESETDTGSISFSGDAQGKIQFSGTGLANSGNSISLSGLPALGLSIPFKPGKTLRSNRIALPTSDVVAKGAGAGEMAGAAVTVNGRLVFVGVPGADGGRGKVFVFRRHGTVLVLEASLEPPAGLDAAEFGKALSADGNQVLIGAPGVPGPSAKGGLAAMQAAIYERLSGDWSVKTTWETTGAADDGFGTSVSLSGETVAIGAPNDDTMGVDAGAVYLYDTTGNVVDTALPADDSQSGGFGSSLDIKDDMMAVGAPDATISSAVSGSVTMYAQILANLTPLTTLSAATPADGDAFGTAVSLEGDMVAIGAPGTDGGENGENDNQGAIDLWSFDGSGFTAQAQIQPEDAGTSAAFGQSLVLLHSGLMAGAPGALGAGGATGAVYEYEFVEDDIFLDGRTSADDTGISDYGASLASDGEIVVIGAPMTEAEAGTAVVVVDAEVLFFDDYETELR